MCIIFETNIRHWTHTIIHQMKNKLCISGFFFLFLWISCQQVSEEYADRKVFRMNMEAGLSSLDPAFARDQSTIWMTAQLYNGLVELDSSLKVVPSIAKSWDISPDGLTYTFLLRKDVFFHKDPLFGRDSTRAVNATDFEYSFRRICDKKTASTGKWVFRGKIQGLDAFDKGEREFIEGFSALNDSVFQVQLTQAFPPFLSLLAMPYAYVLPKEVVEAYGDDYRSHPIGTGPFQFFEWDEGNFLILHKNPHYFELGLPHLNAVSVRFIPSRLSAFIEFKQGKLDFVNGIDDSYKDEILYPNGSLKEEYAEKYQVILTPQLNTEYLGFQTDTTLEIAQNHPLSNKKVRKALNYAIDRKKIVQYLLNGMGYPGNSGFMPKGIPGHDPIKVPGYDYQPEKARQLLAEAGFLNGKGLPEFVLNSNPNYAHISEYVQKAFEEIGISLKINNLQGGALRKEIYGTRINFWRASWIADYPDGENYLSLFYSENHSPNGPNTTHFKNEEFDELYRASLLITDDSSRIEIYQKMERLMLAEAPIIVLYYDRIIRLVAPDIQGFNANPMNHLVLKNVNK